MIKNTHTVIADEMQQVAENLQISRVCQNRNGEMAGIVNQYKQELMDFYEGRHPQENAFMTTTQSQWYQQYCRKQRLREREILVHYKFMQPTIYPRPANTQFPHFQYKHDGKNLICIVSDALFYRKVWERNGRILHIQEPRGKEGHYYLIQSKSVQGNCICPNCGNEDTLEKMMDGCDYCGTKFHIEDYEGKVSSFDLPQGKVLQRNRNPVKLIVLSVIVLAGGLFAASVLRAQGVDPGFLLLTVFAFFFVIIIVLTVFNDTRGAAKNTLTKSDLRITDPHFFRGIFYWKSDE